MNCAWKELLAILPHAFRQEVDNIGKQNLQEIRLRLDKPTELVLHNRRLLLQRVACREDIQFVVNNACRYSPWTSESATEGYITAIGGHRIGLCGDVTMKNGEIIGFRSIHSLNIRVARDITGICGELAGCKGSILILGRPGSGKTTLLRDLIRCRAARENISVVDSRGEIFPENIPFISGQRTDILWGIPKPKGIEMVIRSMSPETVAVDEITAKEDCDALVQAGWCGVKLLATVHGADKQDLLRRAVYRPLVECKLFDTLVIMRQDKSFTVERMGL